MVKFYMYIVALFFLLSCHRNSKNERVSPYNPDTLHLDVEEISDVSHNKFFKRLSVHKLELTDENPISGLPTQFYLDSLKNLYVLDKEAVSIYRFDAKGKYISKIHNIGNGPGEFIELTSFTINHFSGNLELLEPDGRIITYTTEGDFVREINFQDQVKAVHFLEYLTPNVIVLFSDTEGEKLYLYNIEKDELLSLGENIEIDLGIYGLSQSYYRSPFKWIKNKLTYFPTYSNKIRYFTQKELKNFLYLDFGDHTLDIETLEPSYTGDKDPGELRANFLNLKKKHPVGFGDLAMVDSFYFFSFAYHPSSDHFREFFVEALVRIEDHRVTMFHQIGKGKTIGYPIASGNSLYSLVPAAFIDHIVDVNTPLLDNISKKSIHLARDGDNPYLVRFDFK